MGFVDWIRTKEQQRELIQKLQDEITYWHSYYRPKVEWDNPYGWNKYLGSYMVINGANSASFSPITTLSINDPDIKTAIARYGLKKDNIKETADAIEAFLNKNLTYVYDQDNNFHKGYIEWWQQASLTWSIREADCDDYAILFQTMMHICGYGDKSVAAASLKDNVIWYNEKPLGHAYNYVLINNEWVVYDANAGPRKKEVKYPELKDTSFWFNYWNVFQS